MYVLFKINVYVILRLIPAILSSGISVYLVAFPTHTSLCLQTWAKMLQADLLCLDSMETGHNLDDSLTIPFNWVEYGKYAVFSLW